MPDFKKINYSEVMAHRANKLRLIRSDPRWHESYVIHYKTHPIDFINDWCYTLDPRITAMPLMPFVLFPKQEEYIEWLYDKFLKRNDGIVEKSRDLGVSWLSCAYAVWLWLFYEDVCVGFGSNKEENVDSIGDPKSLFEKMRIIIRHLPPEFLPKEFNDRRDMTFRKIINPANGSTLIGESGKNIGRSGRTTQYFKDECAFYDQPLMIESALSMNSDCKIDISTHNGASSIFCRKIQSGEFDVFVFDWRDDPRKSEKWYQAEKKRLDAISPVITACELDRNPFASMENIVIPHKYIMAAVNLKLDDSGDIVAGLDVADEGRDANAIAIRHGVVIKHIECWQQGNTTQTTRKAFDMCNQKNIGTLFFDSIGVGAGVKGEFWSLKEKTPEYKTKIVPINVGDRPTSGYFAKGRKNVDMFINLKAEMWWALRRRFEKTYEYVTEGKEYSHDEMISIPNNDDMIRELTAPQYIINDAGKIKIESKENMKKRGVKSPNIADAVILCFSTKKPANITARIL